MRMHVSATKAEQDLEEAYSDAVSSWDELSTMASLGYAILAGAETYDVAGLCRIRAAELIGPNSTFDTLAPMGAVQVCTFHGCAMTRTSSWCHMRRR